MHSLGMVQGCTSLRKVLEFELKLSEASILKCIYSYMHTHIKHSKQSANSQRTKAIPFPPTSLLFISILSIRLVNVSGFFSYNSISWMFWTAFVISCLDSLHSFPFLLTFILSFFSPYYLVNSTFFLHSLPPTYSAFWALGYKYKIQRANLLKEMAVPL